MLEIIAIQMIQTSWETRQWSMLFLATFVLIVDVVSDLMGIQT